LHAALSRSSAAFFWTFPAKLGDPQEVVWASHPSHGRRQ
jgi:hypothetical protein